MLNHALSGDASAPPLSSMSRAASSMMAKTLVSPVISRTFMAVAEGERSAGVL